MADALSRFPNDRYQGTTHEYTYISEINETKELPKGIYPISLKLIN